MTDIFQTLLRFNLQPCSLAKPFTEKAVGFYVHTDMNFVVTERREDVPNSDTFLFEPTFDLEATALPGAPGS